jgi:hypothetical protein
VANGRSVGVIFGALPTLLITRTTVEVVAFPAESESTTVNGKTPALVGVPENTKAHCVQPVLGAAVMPGGNAPVRVHWNPVWLPPIPVIYTGL